MVDKGFIDDHIMLNDGEIMVIMMAKHYRLYDRLMVDDGCRVVRQPKKYKIINVWRHHIFSNHPIGDFHICWLYLLRKYVKIIFSNHQSSSSPIINSPTTIWNHRKTIIQYYFAIQKKNINSPFIHHELTVINHGETHLQTINKPLTNHQLTSHYTTTN